VFVSLGTAGLTGVYFPVGHALCELVNEGRLRHGVRCAVESTPGSVANLESLRRGHLELALAQSDTVWAAREARGPFAGRPPLDDLRLVLRLHAEPLHLLVRADSGLTALEDLRGHRVSRGPPGSGHRALMDRVLAAAGLTPAALAAAPELPVAAQGRALCGGQVDAVPFAGGVPAGAVEETFRTCPVRLLDLAGPLVARLLAAEPALRPRVIPAGTYPGQAAEVLSLGPEALLVTRAGVPGGPVAEVVRAAMAEAERLSRYHPALRALTRTSLVEPIPGLPFHPGAARAAGR
jgi:TRAP transporter TAXI family solute receptor